MGRESTARGSGRSSTAAIVAVAILVAALAPADAAGRGARRRRSVDLPPRRPSALLGWLDAGTWRATYVPEPAVHVSLGPHGGNVRTWYSPALVEDLAAGRTRFRRGAAMVKELYFGGQTEVRGWSVMAKTRRGRDDPARAWWYYETFDRGGTDAFAGRGLALCAGCHAEGVDYLRSAFRP